MMKREQMHKEMDRLWEHPRRNAVVIRSIESTLNLWAEYLDTSQEQIEEKSKKAKKGGR